MSKLMFNKLLKNNAKEVKRHTYDSVYLFHKILSCRLVASKLLGHCCYVAIDYCPDFDFYPDFIPSYRFIGMI